GARHREPAPRRRLRSPRARLRARVRTFAWSDPPWSDWGTTPGTSSVRVSGRSGVPFLLASSIPDEQRPLVVSAKGRRTRGRGHSCDKCYGHGASHGGSPLSVTVRAL